MAYCKGMSCLAKSQSLLKMLWVYILLFHIFFTFKILASLSLWSFLMHENAEYSGFFKFEESSQLKYITTRHTPVMHSIFLFIMSMWEVAAVSKSTIPRLLHTSNRNVLCEDSFEHMEFFMITKHREKTAHKVLLEVNSLFHFNKYTSPPTKAKNIPNLKGSW